MFEEVIVQLIAWVPPRQRFSYLLGVLFSLLTRAVLQDQPDQVLRDYNFIKARDVWVYELSVVMDFACKVWVVFLCRLEHHLRYRQYLVGNGLEQTALTFEPLVSLCVAR